MQITICPGRQDFTRKTLPQNSVFFAKTMYPNLGILTTITPVAEIKIPNSKNQSKVLTEGWQSCTTMFLMILWYHHLALLYNQGMVGRHLKLPENVESMCVKFSPQWQRGLMPSKLSNDLLQQIQKKYFNSNQKKAKGSNSILLQTLITLTTFTGKAWLIEKQSLLS